MKLHSSNPTSPLRRYITWRIPAVLLLLLTISTGFVSANSMFAQQDKGMWSGSVTNEAGMPLPLAEVSINGVSVPLDESGKFEIVIPSEDISSGIIGGNEDDDNGIVITGDDNDIGIIGSSDEDISGIINTTNDDDNGIVNPIGDGINGIINPNNDDLNGVINVRTVKE